MDHFESNGRSMAIRIANNMQLPFYWNHDFLRDVFDKRDLETLLCSIHTLLNEGCSNRIPACAAINIKVIRSFACQA